LGLRVSGLGYKLRFVWIGVWGSGFRFLGLRVKGSGFRVYGGSGFRVYDLGFRF